LVATGIDSSTSAALYEKTSDIFQSLEQKRTNSYFGPAFRKGKPKENLLKKSASRDKMTNDSLKEVQDEYKEFHFEIYEDADGNVFVKDISIIPVRSAEEVFSVMQQGLRLRATHETKMNTASSRSHCVFSLTVLQRDGSTGDAIKGTINLVDLAGSERVKKSESVGARLREALAINTSLTALGKVIMALDPSSQGTHIPYRDSKLTRILQNTLSGNSYTTLLATIYPNPLYFEECLSTLQFANRCRNVHNHPRVNYIGETEDKDKKIKRLLEEISQLRIKLNAFESRGGGRHAPAFTPSKLVDVLKKLGLNAELAENGEMIIDGKVISAEALGLSEIFSKAGTGDSNDDATDFRNKRVYQELIKEVAGFKQRVREQKEQMERARIENDELRTSVSMSRVTIHDAHSDYKLMVSQYERSLEVQRTTMVQDHEHKMRELVEHNQFLLNRHSSLQESQLQSSSPVGIRSLRSSESMSRAEYIIKLEDIERSRDADVALVRQQYEDLMRREEGIARLETEALARSTESRKGLLRTCEEEIVRLYEYVVYLERVVGQVQSLVTPLPEPIEIRAPSTFGFSTPTKESGINRPLFELTHRVVASSRRHGRATDLLILNQGGFYHSGSGYVDRIKEIAAAASPADALRLSRPQSASYSDSKKRGQARPKSATSTSSSTPALQPLIIPIGSYLIDEQQMAITSLLSKHLPGKLKLKIVSTMSGESTPAAVETTKFLEQVKALLRDKEQLSVQLQKANSMYYSAKIANASLLRVLEKKTSKR
jgi:hypothetical protein